MQVISSVFFLIRNESQSLCREEPLPYQFLRRVFVFFLQAVVQKGPGVTSVQVFLMDVLHVFKLGLQFREDRLREGHCPVLLPFAVVNS